MNSPAAHAKRPKRIEKPGISPCDLCVRALRDPSLSRHLTARDWNHLVPQARQSNLLARLAVDMESAGVLSTVPAEVRNHLESALRMSERHREAVRWEVDRVEDALHALGVPVVLLKGAAYVMADLPAARGRIFSDVDLLVPAAELERVERTLKKRGWAGLHADPYDQKYYRTWMHEIPPLQHRLRQTVLDIHHTILPPTARLRPDPRSLLAAAVALPGHSELYVLSPPDMVLHSATHLFHDGELDNGLRDLVDLDTLLRHFGAEEDFWTALTDRAAEMDLARPLFYALRYTTRLLGTPVPKSAIQAIRASGPAAGIRQVMDALFARGLKPNLPRCNDPVTSLARFALYVRSHWLRMPLYLLVPHLVRKAFKKKRPQ